MTTNTVKQFLSCRCQVTHSRWESNAAAIWTHLTQSDNGNAKMLIKPNGCWLWWMPGLFLNLFLIFHSVREWKQVNTRLWDNKSCVIVPQPLRVWNYVPGWDAGMSPFLKSCAASGQLLYISWEMWWVLWVTSILDITYTIIYNLLQQHCNKLFPCEWNLFIFLTS